MTKYLEVIHDIMEQGEQEITEERVTELEIFARELEIQRLPNEHEIALIESKSAVERINKEIPEIYEEFITQLKEMDVNNAYIEFLVDHVNPQNRIKYRSTAPNENAVCARLEEDDLTKTNIELPSSVVLSLYRELRKNPNYKNLGDSQLVELAVRNFTYHELTHSIQVAYNTLNVPISKRYGFPMFEYKSEIQTSGPKFFTKNSPGYRGRKHMGNDSSIQDRTMESEKQAQGLALRMLGRRYAKELGIPEEEAAKTLYENVSAWYRRSSEPISKIMKSIVEQTQTEHTADNFEAAKKSIIGKAKEYNCKKLEQLLENFQLPAYIGYMYPKKAQDIEEFTGHFRNPPKYKTATYSQN